MLLVYSSKHFQTDTQNSQCKSLIAKNFNGITIKMKAASTVQVTKNKNYCLQLFLNQTCTLKLNCANLVKCPKNRAPRSKFVQPWQQFLSHLPLFLDVGSKLVQYCTKFKVNGFLYLGIYFIEQLVVAASETREFKHTYHIRKKRPLYYWFSKMYYHELKQETTKHFPEYTLYFFALQSQRIFSNFLSHKIEVMRMSVFLNSKCLAFIYFFD